MALNPHGYEMMESRLPIPVVVAVLAATACGVETSDHSVVAVVRGVVTTGANAPVAGARITVTIVDTTTQRPMINELLATTDAAGRFERLVGVFLAPEFIGRVTLTVSPPDSVALPDSTLDVGHVPFRIGVPETLSVAVAYP